MLPAARAALEWMDRYGDIDNDGFLEYQTRAKDGVEHQGWKDSPDALVDENGQQVDAPVAASEIQGYYYAALRGGAALLALLGDRGSALRLLTKARRLRAAFDEAFWIPE